MKLSSIITEMPLTTHVAGEKDAQQNPWNYKQGMNYWGLDFVSGDEPHTHDKLFKAWASPKFHKVLSDKLSRLLNYNIILFVGGNIDYYYGREHGPSLDDISKKSGIPIETLKNSITVNIVGSGGGQDMATPWIILHQVAEALIGDTDAGDLLRLYAPHLESDPDDDIDSMWDAIYNRYLYEYFGPRSAWGELSSRAISGSGLAYSKLFKFKSAQNPSDMDQEILTEYMWHGGKIRMRKIPEIPQQVLDAVKQELLNICDAVLKKAVGFVHSNAID